MANAGKLMKARLNIQSDWEKSRAHACDCDGKVVNENEASAWISYKHSGKSKSVCGKICFKSDNHVECSDGFTVNLCSQNLLDLHYQDADTVQSSRFQAPSAIHSNVHKKNVVSMDVSEGGLGLSADSSNNLLVWDSENGEVRRRLDGHIADVYTCRLFPSGSVALTGGADMQIKIWSLDKGLCAVTLTGHKAAIQDTAIVELGKNVVSVSKDGTAKLWSCGKACCLATIAPEAGAVNCCSLQVESELTSQHCRSAQEADEVQTGDKVLLLGFESGRAQCWALHDRLQICNVDCSSAVNACRLLGGEKFLVGTQDSQILLYDLRNSSSPVQHVQECRSHVTSMLPFRSTLIVGYGDGSCLQIDKELQTKVIFTGPDCDPVTALAHDLDFVYTACRDGKIRKYKL